MLSLPVWTMPAGTASISCGTGTPGEWHCVGERLSLTEALDQIASEPYFQPIDPTTGVARTSGQLVAIAEDMACRAKPPHWRCA
jgi:hypothetical protein